MYRIVALLFVTLLFYNFAFANDLTQRLSILREARWGLVTVELKTGEELIKAGNSVGEPLVPASLVKLFTTGAVLDHSARNGRPDMRTAVFHDVTIRDGMLDGNLYLRGQGNALLSAGDLQQAARKLAEQGIRTITGSIIADDMFFDTKGLERSRKGPGHAPSGALGLDLHTLAVIVTPTEPGKQPKVTIEPLNDAVRLAVEARTVATGVAGIKVAQLDDMSFRVTGNIPADSGSLK